MINLGRIIFLTCGLLLTLAAFPVFAQDAEENKINQKPLKDFIEYVSGAVAKDKVDLTKPFAIELEGVLTKDGKLDSKKSKFIESDGDAKTIDVAKTFIEAINDSGLFFYLKGLGVEKIKLALVQDDSQVYADMVLEQPTSEKAKTFASMMNAMLRMVLLTSERRKEKMSDDERMIIQGITASSENKNATLKFVYQKSVVHEMINRKLQELEQK